ncbi:MAG TPA: beta-ketoacyl synthase [Legionellales bacterium]|nr:beta-ketoacyl synthase [Legionellales bacterium]
MKLPVIVGMGGINAAGRTSGFHSYKRMVYKALPQKTMEKTWSDLAHRMGLSTDKIQSILDGTLIRQIDLFNPNHVYAHQAATLASNLNIDVGDATELLLAGQSIFWEKFSSMAVQSAGMLPRGFDPAKLYNSHHHPRGLILTVYAMSDALSSLGLDWNQLLTKIKPDQVSVYAGSALAQVDEHSLAGLIAQPLKGKRVNSKMMPLSLAEMPADFVNSYILNSVGTTGHNMGACATFLYNLRQGIRDIQHGHAKIAIVGSAEAPVNPDIIEGFRTMSALASDEALCKLDNSEVANFRRACRPFSTNAGFVIAESSQFAILMADDLALEVGAPILGSVADVYVNADGNKKSIASPGVGNYITMAKACSLAQAMLGQKGLQDTYVQAHGTGTPQNRVTESHILSETAKTFGIKDWTVCAVKSYVGHSIGVAAGDQLAATLGAWQYGVLPGIETIDHIASDVYQDNLNFLMQHRVLNQAADMKGCIINAKGFGGNNASALIMSPEYTKSLLEQRFGQASLKKHATSLEKTLQTVSENDDKICRGEEELVYHFGDQMMGMEDVHLGTSKVKLKNFVSGIELPQINPYIHKE